MPRQYAPDYRNATKLLHNMEVYFTIAGTIHTGKIVRGPYVLDQEWVVDVVMHYWNDSNILKSTSLDGLYASKTDKRVVDILSKSKFPKISLSSLEELEQTAQS
jgi:hypothetical protein